MVLSRTGAYLRWGLLGFLVVPAAVLGLRLLGHDLMLWSCPLKALTGIPCPTWGMTRSVVAIATLHPHQSIQHHLFGPLVLMGTALFLAILVTELYTRQSSNVWSSLRRVEVWFPALLAIFAYHGYRLGELWIAGTLQTDFHLSPLGHWVHAVL
ncbi:MAG: DUF2752 domain-containing protein [Cyanobacteria bacterium J06632_22]